MFFLRNSNKFCFLLQLLTFSIFGQSTWEQKSPLPQGNTLNSATFGNDMFVAVGNKGAILISSDGIYWKTINSGTTAKLSSVTFNSGQFVTVGSFGTILTSTNGVDWHTNLSGTAFNLNSITYGNNKFVAVGDSGTILTSGNGTTWVSEISHVSFNLSSVAFGKGRFVAIGGWGSQSGEKYVGSILTSSDGAGWTCNSKPEYYCLSSVTFGQDLFIASGNGGGHVELSLFTSTDGIEWTYQSGDYDLYSVTSINGLFVGTTFGMFIMTSNDGINWQSKSLGNIDLRLNSVVYGKGLYVAVGQSGVILSSADLSIWVFRSSGVYCHISYITYEKDRFIALGNNANKSYILSSIDGTNWTSTNLDTTTIYRLTSAAYGNDQFVIIGNGLCFTSSNGLDWIKHQFDPAPPFPFYSVDYLSMTFGKGIYVGICRHYYKKEIGYLSRMEIWTSSDGVTWLQKDTTLNCDFVTFQNGMFYAKGDSLYASTDGNVWSLLHKNETADSSCNGNCIIMESSKIVSISQDGSTWSLLNSSNMETFRSVAYGNGKFVALSNDSTVLISNDGAHWSAIPDKVLNGKDLLSVAYGDNKYVAVGNNGSIFISKADQVAIKSNNIKNQSTHKLKINIANSSVLASLPAMILTGIYQVKIFNISGKLICFCNTRIQDGVMNIPKKGFKAGKYFMKISDENNRVYQLTFLLN